MRVSLMSWIEPRIARRIALGVRGDPAVARVQLLHLHVAQLLQRADVVADIAGGKDSAESPSAKMVSPVNRSCCSGSYRHIDPEQWPGVWSVRRTVPPTSINVPWCRWTVDVEVIHLVTERLAHQHDSSCSPILLAAIACAAKTVLAERTETPRLVDVLMVSTTM